MTSASRGRSSRRGRVMSPSSSSEGATLCCARSSTSAGTAATSSATAPGGARRCSARYHAWTYDLDGSLRTAPRSDSEPGFDREALGLVPVAVDTWGPFVFVNPDSTAGSLTAHLGDLPRLVAAGGVDVDALVFHQRAEGEYDANWKVCVENYLECYHCAVAHPSFSKAIDVAPGMYTLEEHPTFSSQYGPPKNGGGGVYDATGEVERGQFHLLFPATTINVMPGRGNFSIGPVVPLAAERTYRYLDYFFLPATDDEWIADYLELDNQVGAEDRGLVEAVQAGMRSGVIHEGYVLPESERLIAHFERLLVDALGARPREGGPSRGTSHDYVAARRSAVARPSPTRSAASAQAARARPGRAPRYRRRPAAVAHTRWPP